MRLHVLIQGHLLKLRRDIYHLLFVRLDRMIDQLVLNCDDLTIASGLPPLLCLLQRCHARLSIHFGRSPADTAILAKHH